MSDQDSQLNTFPAICMQNQIPEQLISAEITNIRWERINMHLICKIKKSPSYNRTAPLEFYALTDFYRTNAKFKVLFHEDEVYELTLNITNPGYCKCLPSATYRIAVCTGEQILAIAEVSPDLAPFLPDKSREFLYSKKNCSYIIDFSIADEEYGLRLEFRALNTRKSKIADYSRPLSPKKASASHSLFPKSKVKKWIRKYYTKKAGKFDRSYTGTPRTILFMSEQSEQLGSNLTSVMNRMKQRGLDKNYTILTSARSAVNKHYNYKSWYTLINKVAQADIIFIDDHCPFLDWLILSRRTRLIQLWHAGAGFKSSGYSRWGHKGCPGPMSGHRQYDYGITSSVRIAHFYSEVFGINPEQLLPTGMPRMDEYLNPEYRNITEKNLYEIFPQIKDRKVILFAPTYRGKNRSDAHYPYEMIDFDRMYKFCADEYVILFKMHPWVAQPVPIPKAYRDKMIDVNKYPNINDLFYVTDLMITDYSSGIFEYSLMRKPMLFFAFDEIQYSYSRGFHRPYEESAPGKVCHTFDELMDAMEKKDYDYEKVGKYIKLHFDNIDTNASDRVIDWFLLGHIPEEYERRIDAITEENKKLLQLDFSSLDFR